MNAPREPVPVALLGATGSVGQRFVRLLEGHPWFRPTSLGASPRSAGKRYGDAVRWSLDGAPPADVASMTLRRADEAFTEPLVLSALDADVAGPIEAACAAAGALVVTNARNHRMDAGVPLVVPEVNPDHLALLDGAARRIVANPNCATIGLVLALAPLHRAFGVRRVIVTSMQALSGAGLVGGEGLRLDDTLVPFIGGEEDKLVNEPRKILGAREGEAILPASIEVSPTCVRVPVSDGHTLSVSVELARPAGADDVRAAWDDFRAPEEVRGLPSAPARPLVVLDDADAPQPAAHRDLGAGMTASVGRLRPCGVLDWKFVTLSHNTVRGAAGGALLAAELAVARGLLRGAVDAG